MPRKQVTAQKRILNCIPSSQVERDWVLENAIGSEMAAAPAKLPDHVDLRDPQWGVGDQMETGSCVGWATADAVLRYSFAKAGRIDLKDLLSVRFIWMAAKETDEYPTPPTAFIEEDGTSLKAALDVARKYGEVTESILPFEPIKLYAGDVNTFYAIAAKLKIAAYFNLHRKPDGWRTWLAMKGPVLTRLGVDATWDNATNTNGNLDVYQPDTVRGGHAVAMVGYTAEGRFIVRNSWGTSWGDKGFGYASAAYAQAAFTEAYGVTVV
jgi:hypothetical protein